MAHNRLWGRLAPLRGYTFAGSVLMLMALASMVLVSGCGSKENGAGQAGGPPRGMAGRPGGGPGMMEAAIPVALAPAVSGPIASYYNATATLEAEKEARVLARVTGVVESLLVEEGDQVQEGQPLLTVDNHEYQYRLRQAEAATQNLRSRFERFEAMLQEQLTTEEEFQAARSDLATAEAEEGMARLNLSYTTVRAPFTGKVTQRLVDVGQNLSVGTELMVMADFDPLLARVHVPSREFNQLKQDQTVGLVLDSNGEQLAGRIKLISPVIDPTSGTIKITVEVPEYPADTRPGDFAEVRIVTELRPGALLVPRTAVITDKGETIVFVAVAGGGEPEGENRGPDGPRAERRIVSVGFTDDDHTQITGGLEAGELVVVKGQRSLKHGSPLKVLEGPGSEQAPPAVAEKREGRGKKDGPTGGGK
jgi:membrane fusion protein (multidrug efflux system)